MIKQTQSSAAIVDVAAVRPRLIPVLLLKHGVIVRSQLFSVHQVIGNPMSTVDRLSHWNVDELVILDISRGEGGHDLRRDDLHQQYAGDSAIDVLREIAKCCFMPLTFGGRIRSLHDIEERLDAGADKVVITTAAFDDPSLVEAAARRFGSQCIVGGLDVRRKTDGTTEAFVDGGQRATARSATNLARDLVARGVGEIFLSSIDRDGSGQGFDTRLIEDVVSAVAVPVVACGGVGRYEDFPVALQSGAAATAAANIFHFFELSYSHAKQACIDAGMPMRPVGLGSRFLLREPVYDRPTEDARIAKRLEQARTGAYPARVAGEEKRQSIRWCTACVYPSISAAPMEFDAAGVCTGCQIAKVKAQIPAGEWTRRRELLREIVERARAKDGARHDVVVAVSGGKDSYFQVHVLKEEFGLNPLLVTYDGNNWTDVGWRNMVRMREAFDVDHIVVRPSVSTLQKLNRLAFVVMGDMNWHGHVGIMTTPMRVAVQHRIPLVFYGEHGYLDLCGQFSMDDFPEVTFRDRLEHFARGFEWTYFLGREGLTSSQLDTWKYPSDQELFDVDLRGIFLGNYVHWEANDHIKLVRDRYGFEISEEPFDRTYRTMSNLDDMHENGAHDYLKYIKFGYGRATDHACKDVRAGMIDRNEAINLVKRYDHVRPRDIERWLNYTGFSERDFDAVADTFRDPRVWRLGGNGWIRDQIDD